LGFWVGHIPVVADFVEKYIDLVLLGVVIVVLLPTIYHYVQALVKARKAKHRHSAEALDKMADPDELALDPKVFEKRHGAHTGENPTV
jgi:membrane-associated protein